MPRRLPAAYFAKAWNRSLRRSVDAMTRTALRAGKATLREATRIAAEQTKPPPGDGDWLLGVAVAPGGMRRYRLFKPRGLGLLERAPLVVMLHGCHQDARGFAIATRMNALAARERFVVLYPEQDRIAHPHGCWNWYETRSGRADGEARIVMNAIDQAIALYRADQQRVAIVGLSAGASLAGLMAMRHPERFAAVAMHSGVGPGMAHSSATAIAAMSGRRGGGAALDVAEDKAALLPGLLVIHGGADRVVSSSNARHAVERWAAAASAIPGAPRVVQRGQRHAMTITDYRRLGRTRARLCEIEALGHAWSGGARDEPFSDPAGPDASRLIWAFVRQQFQAMDDDEVRSSKSAARFQSGRAK